MNNFIKRLIFILILSVVPLSVSSMNIHAQNYYREIMSESQDVASSQLVEQAGHAADQGDSKRAIVLYTIVCDRYSPSLPLEEKLVSFQSFFRLADYYHEEGFYSNSLETAVKGLRASEESGDKEYAGKFYNVIGKVYCVFLDYEKGLVYFKQAYNLANSSHDKQTIYRSSINITGAYLSLGRLKDARKFFDLSKQHRDSSDPEDIYMGDFILGLMRINGGENAQAARDFVRLASFSRSNNLKPKYTAFAYSNAFRAFSNINRKDSAIHYLRLAEKTAVENGIQHLFVQALKNIADYYESEGNPAQANLYRAKYIHLQDSLLNVREFSMVKNMQFQYELDKSSKEFNAVKESEQQKTQIIRRQFTAILICIASILAIGVVLFVIYRQKKKLTESYSNLYALNREFINREQEMSKRHREYAEIIEAKQNEIEKLRDSACAKDENNKTDADTSEGKYQSSALRDDRSRQLEEAITDVMENTLEFCNHDFSLNTLAALVGSNSKYVSQVINDSFNKNFTTFVNSYRVRLACVRISDFENYGNMNLRGIAESVGFKSYTSFVNTFGKMTGITPSVYQKMAKKDVAAAGN